MKSGLSHSSSQQPNSTHAAIRSATRDDRLHLTLLPTEACNFRCEYCYEDHIPTRMSDQTVWAVKELLSARVPQLSELELTWFGGEPLLALDIVSDLTRFARKLCTNHNVQFASNATTNGYLLSDSTMHHLVDVGLTGFQISLDGPEQIHDVTRIRAGGRPTFHTIWSNLISAKRSDLEFVMVIRVHFSPKNVHLIEQLIVDLKHEFGFDRRFRIFFKSIEHLGSPADEIFEIFDQSSGEAIKSKLYESLAPELFPFHISGDQNAPYICYAAAANAFVIRSDGSVTKCTVDLYSEAGLVGRLLDDGRLALEADKIKPWLLWLTDFDAAKMSCPKGWVHTAMPATSIPVSISKTKPDLVKP